jgi:hypothetical protein
MIITTIEFLTKNKRLSLKFLTNLAKFTLKSRRRRRKHTNNSMLLWAPLKINICKIEIN